MNDPLNPYAPPETESSIPAPESGDALAGRGARLGASIVDGLVQAIVLLPLMWFTGYFSRAMEKAMAQAEAGGASVIELSPEPYLWALAGVVIFIVINWVFLQNGQTVGKRLLGIKIVRKDGSPIAATRIITHRFLPVQVAALVPVIGPFLVLVDCLLIFRKDKNTLHDDIAGTKVIQALKTA